MVVHKNKKASGMLTHTDLKSSNASSEGYSRVRTSTPKKPNMALRKIARAPASSHVSAANDEKLNEFFVSADKKALLVFLSFQNDGSLLHYIRYVETNTPKQADLDMTMVGSAIQETVNSVYGFFAAGARALFDKKPAPQVVDKPKASFGGFASEY